MLRFSIVLFFSSITIFQINAQSTPDPGLPGTYAVTTGYYNLGDLAYNPPSFPHPVEVGGSVHYPTLLSGGPFPVLVFLHGRHETCYQTSDPSNTSLAWPCAIGDQSITSFEGYNYLAQQMASHGYIVISISCNAINADDNSLSDYGMAARAELMQHHLDLWNTYNTVGGAPFGTLFVGKLDMNNIGTMGHSRGGEGVVANALYNRSLGSPYGRNAVLTLAPVDFLREVLTGIPFMNIAPYCDGDVDDIQGVHYMDDARYAAPTEDAPMHSVLLMGADHNFFNTVWTPGLYPAGGVDDWWDASDVHCGSGVTNKRLSPTQQQAAFNAYASAFFRLYIGHETSFAPILEVDDIIPPASSALDSSAVFMSYHAPYSKRLDINRTTIAANETFNSLSGAVTSEGLLSSGICGAFGGCGISSSHNHVPHEGSAWLAGLSQMAITWDSATDYYENTIPVSYQNMSNYVDLQFRAAVNYAETTPGSNLNFTVQLIDSVGNVSSQVVSDHTHSLFYQPGTPGWELPKVLFNTIKIPLTDFTGIDLSKVRQIKFLFDQTTQGSFLIADIALSGHPIITTSIKNNLKFVNISVYPNPASDIITVDLGTAKDKIELYLYNAQGRLVLQLKNEEKQSIKIDLNNFAKGIYILNITGNAISGNCKIVKQ